MHLADVQADVAAMRPTQMSQREQPSDAPALNVRLPDGNVLRFHSDFHIGRDPGCEVCIQDAHASRRHAQVSFVRGQWWIRDLQSSNGLFVDDERVEAAPIGEGVTVRLGEDGPVLQIGPGLRSVLAPAGTDIDEDEDDSRVDEYADRYLVEDDSDEEVGDRTRMIRVAFQKHQKKQKRQQRWIVAILVLVGLGAAGYAYRAHKEAEKVKADAREFFYQMKDLDITLAAIQEDLLRTTAGSAAKISELEEQRRRLEQRYEQIAERAYGRSLTPQDRLILRMTRLFGECEVAAPREYLGEVHRYINEWRRTSRFEDAVKRAQAGGYTRRIASAFMQKQLPPQFFYLAMQESNFIPTAVGPPTRFGFAKGMWQFIPETGERYGLKRGPFAQDARVDLADERSHWEKATVAAASYIKDIYRTDAQASGLLVMASYNWGEGRVINRLKKMPQSPRERNFWTLLAQYPEDVPGQTYNYVFSIVSAAVIGENPRLFGFQFDNPLAFPVPSR
jgi:peptidoglycan lytic transglycosylase D